MHLGLIFKKSDRDRVKHTVYKLSSQFQAFDMMILRYILHIPSAPKSVPLIKRVYYFHLCRFFTTNILL